MLVKYCIHNVSHKTKLKRIKAKSKMTNGVARLWFLTITENFVNGLSTLWPVIFFALFFFQGNHVHIQSMVKVMGTEIFNNLLWIKIIWHIVKCRAGVTMTTTARHIHVKQPKQNGSYVPCLKTCVFVIKTCQNTVGSSYIIPCQLPLEQNIVLRFAF